jgi:hypothetical protein
MLALRSERVMIFSGPFSPRFTADTFVVSVNVGEGGPAPAPGEALRFPCGFVVIVKGLRGRDLGIGERGFGPRKGGERGMRKEGLEVQSKPLALALRFGRPQVVLRATLAEYSTASELKPRSRGQGSCNIHALLQ